MATENPEINPIEADIVDKLGVNALVKIKLYAQTFMQKFEELEKQGNHKEEHKLINDFSMAFNNLMYSYMDNANVFYGIDDIFGNHFQFF